MSYGSRQYLIGSHFTGLYLHLVRNNFPIYYWTHYQFIVAIDLSNSLVQELFRNRGSVARSNDSKKVKSFFPFPKREDEPDNDDDVDPGLPRYPFIIKLRNPAAEYININLRKKMVSQHPFSHINADVSLFIY